MATIAPLRIRSRGELNLTPPVFLLIHPPVKAQCKQSPAGFLSYAGDASARSSYNAIARADFRANLVRYRRRAFDLLAGPDQGIGAVRRARQVDLWSHSGDPADHLSKAPITGYPSIVILRLIWLLTAAVTAGPPTRPFIDPSIAIRSLLAGRTARIRSEVLMRGIPDEMLAALSKEEIGMLWRVFETVCIEYDIPRDGEQIQHLARFLMREFRRPLDEEALLVAAKTFYRHHDGGFAKSA
ncbi:MULTISPECIES: hypothetical protein [unclassified Ensifer]|uniref:hypothetical protein n=1 Tax=unclassified Ensifer TaxID=2633371 RepID=UPI001FCCECEF|nr:MULTISPECIES: hypothetical protein [unclassified Ensifer]MDP9631179.1 hypothetical protein [Ensifer adhaerens]